MNAQTTTTTTLRFLTMAIVALAAAAAALLALPATGNAAQPQKFAYYTGATSQTNGRAKIQIDAYGNVMDMSFEYACANGEPAAAAARFTQGLWRLGLPKIKPTKAGGFWGKRTLKTWKLPRQIGFGDPSGPFLTASLAFKGRFVTKTKAVGTFSLTEPGCKTGVIRWTATLGGK